MKSQNQRENTWKVVQEKIITFKGARIGLPETDSVLFSIETKKFQDKGKVALKWWG